MPDKIPLFKVFIAEGAIGRVADTFESGYVGQGPRVDELEAKLQEILDLPRKPITVCSGTAGLDLIWHLLGIGPGSEVISTPMTCSATNGQLVTRGARIVWADVDSITGLIDPADVVKKLTERTKAIVAVDWAGRVCDYAALRRHGIPVVEDAAHAFLARGGIGEQIGWYGGDYIMWSFQAIKHFTTCDGGAIQVPENQDARARLLRWYGLDRTKGDSFRCAQNIREAGFKYHMNDVAASVGLANIEHAQRIVEAHRKNAEFYESRFYPLREIQPARVTPPPPDAGSSWWLYTLLVDDQAGFIRHMGDLGIAASPVHARNDKHDAFRFQGGPLPGVDFFSSHEVAIPVGWWLSDEDLERVAQGVEAWARI